MYDYVSNLVIVNSSATVSFQYEYKLIKVTNSS